MLEIGHDLNLWYSVLDRIPKCVCEFLTIVLLTFHKPKYITLFISHPVLRFCNNNNDNNNNIANNVYGAVIMT